MALYFFHLRNHEERLLDPQGRDIEDPVEIPGIALAEARGLMAHDILTGIIDLDQWLEVTDGEGRIVHRLSFREAVRIGRRGT